MDWKGTKKRPQYVGFINLGGGREGDYDDAHVVPAPLVEARVDHLGLNLNHI